VALGAAGPAYADSILYRCQPNLCRVAPDGTGVKRLTRDGRSGGPAYGWLSATPDGTRLGVSFGNRAHVLAGSGKRIAGPLPHSGGAVLVTQIRPDGRQVATLETVGESIPPPLRFVPYLFLADADGSGRETVARSTAARPGSATACCGTTPPTARRSSSRSACWPRTATSPASGSWQASRGTTCGIPPCRLTAGFSLRRGPL
jgi:hypothetical protein